MKYIVALDQGTTSSRAVVVDENGKVVAVHGMEFPQIYPQPGWVEHDPAQILSSQVESLKKAVEKAAIDPKDIVGIGITNQRETTIIWDKATGKPVCNAIVWQCRRRDRTTQGGRRERNHPQKDRPDSGRLFLRQ